MELETKGLICNGNLPTGLFKNYIQTSKHVIRIDVQKSQNFKHIYNI